MSQVAGHHKRWRWRVGLRAIAVGLLALLLASCGGEAAEPTAPEGEPTAQATATPIPLNALQVSPGKGLVGTTITVIGEGLPTSKPVEFLWATWDGSYDMGVFPETVEFYDRKFAPTRVPLGQAATDGQGRVTATLVVPEDYGDTHDIYAVVDGQDVAKGAFSVVRNVSISPLSGPLGTPITIEVKGLGKGAYTNTMGVLYGNRYTGFISAVTTRGTARATIRAAGPVGDHQIRVTDASAATPYLNTEQSPRKLPQFKFPFAVTEDAGPPPLTLDWPDANKVVVADSLPKTTSGGILAAASLSTHFSASSGPILSKSTLQATGLPPDAEIDLLWVTAKGNRVSQRRWSLIERPVGKATVGKDGALAAPLDVPDDLGGWHMVRLVQGEKVLTEVPYYVERSLVGVTPLRVKAGETFTIQIKGIGWTELDNGVAVTYDNAYMGYSCGFNSQGDVTIYLQATGGLGTHLIDLYPMVFKGHGEGPWNHNIPNLTFAQDFPGLSLGYRLPAYRLAIEVVE